MPLQNLHRLVSSRIEEWQKGGFPHEVFPKIAEILDFQLNGDGSLRWLRAAQVEALTTYWYLRLVEETPHILDL